MVNDGCLLLRKRTKNKKDSVTLQCMTLSVAFNSSIYKTMPPQYMYKKPAMAERTIELYPFL